MNKLRILYVSHLYDPEPGAQPVRVRNLTARWAAAGHDVTVLTSFPNHPSGHISPGFRRRYWKFADSEIVDGVRIVRTWTIPRPNHGSINRFISFGSYMLSAAITSNLLRPYDVVIGTVPQPLTPLAAWSRASFGRARFVLEIRDLWPEGLVATGQARAGSLSVVGLGHVADFLYARAARIVAVTDAIKSRVAARSGRPLSEIDVVRAGVDVDSFRVSMSREQAKGRLGLGDRYVVSYVGTLGNAHGLETVLDAAGQIQSSAPDVMFVLAGSGAEDRRLRAIARDSALTNVLFLGQQPRAAIPEILAASDVCLAVLRDDPLFQTVMPTKIYEYMAARRPVISNVPGEAMEILEKAGAGLAVAPGSPSALADGIMRLRGAPDLATKMAASGERFVLEDASWDSRAAAYLRTLEIAISN